MHDILAIGDINEATGLLGMVYFIVAALVTLSIDVIRRYVRRRLEIWEANNPVPTPKEGVDDDPPPDLEL
jgi:hypothetical protein